MTYEYREVKCPWCGHVFMWNKNGFDITIHEYRLKETGEVVKRTTCPKCSMEMIVMEHILEGIDIKDDRIEAFGIRGI